MSREHYDLYMPGQIGPLSIPNRFVRSGTADISLGRVGGFTGEDVALYRNLALGGVGMMIVNGPPVLPDSVCSMDSLTEWLYCYDDICVKNTALVLAAIREASPQCKVIAQLECNALISGGRPAGPSAVTSPYFEGRFRELSVDEIHLIIDAFVQTIGRMQAEGFDGVQLHGAHGGALWYFLSPRGNQRNDAYGGSPVNRVRIVAEIVQKARDLVGAFPLMVKVNCTDNLAGGIDKASFPDFAHALERAGIDAIEVSGGTWDSLIRTESELGFRPVPAAESHTHILSSEKQNYYLPYVQDLDLSIPIILVGGIRNVDRAEAVIRTGGADFVALCRPLIREPNLIQRWKETCGDAEASCLACNSCIYSMYLPPERLGRKTVTCLVDHDATLHAEAQNWLSTYIDQIRVR